MYYTLSYSTRASNPGPTVPSYEGAVSFYGFSTHKVCLQMVLG